MSLEEADALLNESREAAKRMLAEAHEEAARMLAAAREQGAAEGAQEAQHMREEIAGLEVRMLGEVEHEIVRAALRVAKDILAVEVQTREDAVVDVAVTAMQSSKNARDLNLRVNPRDAKTLRDHKERLVAALTRARDLDIREDRRVAPGGVLIETESGVVDAQLETQLAEIERVLGG
jgi:flagellar biosynthesis/type III secretory pathway protein FliH